MDTVTHALAGALAGRAGAGRLPAGRAMLATLAACIFPDIDFVVALFDPYAYLLWHRLLTHTFVLLPVWAVALAMLAGALDRRHGWLAYLPYMVAGIALHIVMDAFNVWPLKPLWPLSEWTLAVPVLFVIDPLYTGIVVAGLAVSWRLRSSAAAWAALAVLAAYTAVQFPLDAAAVRQARASPEAADAIAVRAYGQPLSPFHRRVVVVHADGLRWAFLRQAGADGAPAPGQGFWRALWHGFRALETLDWRDALHPLSAGELAAWAWNHPDLALYREFATMPYLYAVEREGERLCVWFADARFTLPTLEPAFRYGMCRAEGGDWTSHRRGRW